MKESIYKDYDELPLFLNAGMVADLLGVSPSTAYELMHEDGFREFFGTSDAPILTFSKRKIPKNFVGYAAFSQKGFWVYSKSDSKIGHSYSRTLQI